jgi:hypothetical protein
LDDDAVGDAVADSRSGFAAHGSVLVLGVIFVEWKRLALKTRWIIFFQSIEVNASRQFVCPERSQLKDTEQASTIGNAEASCKLVWIATGLRPSQ